MGREDRSPLDISIVDDSDYEDMLCEDSRGERSSSGTPSGRLIRAGGRSSSIIRSSRRRPIWQRRKGGEKGRLRWSGCVNPAHTGQRSLATISTMNFMTTYARSQDSSPERSGKYDADYSEDEDYKDVVYARPSLDFGHRQDPAFAGKGYSQTPRTSAEEERETSPGASCPTYETARSRH